ncbi:hypothetical protein HHK36_027170 [Tetracentron sinense]|uniref:PA domain-containing protein n=1 Tax=Tetracentron sinense TaxID=13715 RepID=A0A835D2W8_TETSI|nr:hypothetical protein HHK36_027170 [Tetracentron sinense]
MAFSKTILRLFAVLLLFLIICLSSDGASHDDDSAPKSASCNNKFQLVKVKNWVDGIEGESIVGLSASFGASLPSHADKALRLPAVFANPLNCCASSSSKLSNSIALSMRGDCAFTAKAQVANSGGAAGLLVINDKEDLYKMICSENDTSLDITIPVVMIPKSGGEAINESMAAGGNVELLLYSPKHPVVDFSEIFLWLMAVGTIVCASLWSEFIACEQNDERYDELTPKGMHACIVTLILRICRNCGQKTLNLPFLGEVSILSIGVLLSCVAFAVFWAANQHASYAWIGQDVLGICLMITVLQMARLPNIKVASTLLCCAFVYDIFWVFISPLIFHESVMIAN